VQRCDLGADVAFAIVVMREAERRATPAGGRIARARHDVGSLLSGADHRHHDAHRAQIERTGDEVILAARHAHHRDDRQPAAQCELRLERLEAEPGVLHVEQHEFRARIQADLRQSGREELEHHRAECAPAGGERALDRVVADHRVSSFDGGPACMGRLYRA
jgi:hypothetical protein